MTFDVRAEGLILRQGLRGEGVEGLFLSACALKTLFLPLAVGRLFCSLVAGETWGRFPFSPAFSLLK